MIYTLVISQMSHDSSIVLFKNDEVAFFMPCERNTRIKHDGEISYKSLKEIAEISKSIDLMIINCMHADSSSLVNKVKNDFKKFNCSIKQTIEFNSNKPVDLIHKSDPLSFSHHDIHALSAFYMSPFDEAVCLVIDGVGSTSHISVGKTMGFSLSETTTIVEISKSFALKNLYKKFFSFPLLVVNGEKVPSTYGGVTDSVLNELKKQIKTDVTLEISNHFDIGQIYNSVSNFLSFGLNHGSGKTMGLSAYGNSENNMPKILLGDSIVTDNNLLKLNREIDTLAYPKLNAELTEQDRANFARNTQVALEKIFLHHAEFIIKKSKHRNLVIGGGCALNILGISAIKERYPEFNIFVDPIATDATQAIGIGIHSYNHFFSKQLEKKKDQFKSIYLGERYGLEKMKEKIDSRF